MDIEQIRKITPYQEINELLVDWVRGLKNVLGNNIVGIYLSGSLAYGDFVPERSDIDLQAVVRRPLTGDEIKAVESLHKELNNCHPEWAKRMECSYVPLEIMREVFPPKMPRPWWGFDAMYESVLAGNEWLINHYFLSKYGIALEGPDFNSLIPKIDIREVQKASARDLFKEWEPKINDPEWLENSHYQSYLVLNLARILHTVIGGQPGSKKTAAEWVKAAYPQWKNLIEEAERWKYGMEIKRKDDVKTFIKFILDQVDKIGISK